MGKIALLSCGGSVLETWPKVLETKERSLYDYVVGVNWVGELYECDYLCMKDQCLVARGLLKPPRIGVVNGGGVEFIWKGRRSYENFARWDKVAGWCGPVVCGYTFPDALKWCCEKWTDKEIDVFGCDMDQEKGVCKDSWNHGIGRWAREAPFIAHMLRLNLNRIQFVGCRLNKDLVGMTNGS
jgi:hypothetical protein